MRTCEENLSLLHRLAEGLLDPDEAKALEKHVDECEACSSELEEFLQIKTVVEKGLDQALIVPKIVDGILASPREPGHTAGRIRLALKWAGISFATVVAAMVLIVTGYLYNYGLIWAGPVAGRLSQASTAGDKWVYDEMKIMDGMVVSTETGERRSLRLSTGVIVILNEKTGLEVKSESRLKLLRGEIYIDTVGQKDLMLRVETAHADTVVTGTRLGVSTEEDQTSVVVEEGKVSVESEWGEQVVILGNIYHIIESMKPEPPEPIDVEEMFFWVQERAHLAGLIIDQYGQDYEEPSSIEDDEELLHEVLHGLKQSQKAIWSGDIIFDVAHYAYGVDLTDEENREYIEHVVAGQISLLDPQNPPSEDVFREYVQHVRAAAMLQTTTEVSEETINTIFSMPYGARQDELDPETNEFHTTMVNNRGDGGFGDRHPAYFGRYRSSISSLRSARLVRVEELDEATVYLLEAELDHRTTVRLWVDPSLGYAVRKERVYYAPLEEHVLQSCRETIAESFEEVLPGVFYPRVYKRIYYPGDVISNEKILLKQRETIYTLSEGEFNTNIPGAVFEAQISPFQPERKYLGGVYRIIAKRNDDLARHSEGLRTAEYLRRTYDELEQIKLYDSPTAAGSRKLMLRVDGKKLAYAIATKGGIIYTGAPHAGELVGVAINQVDPAISAEIPFLPGDVIFTLNDEPWKVYGPDDWIDRLVACKDVVKAGRPVTAGMLRNGKLQYVVIWAD